ncbi:transcriptional regulator FtsR [Rubrobacter aplysinae]|uniref:transcriptional regulator FtsR n=1 Tax=Rubrobacter aplysinae TaxID=909625 RepID=UPI000A03E8D2|nr:MerR family transcriptional regulator [Rubrobacter aplysinae]
MDRVDRSERKNFDGSEGSESSSVRPPTGSPSTEPEPSNETPNISTGGSAVERTEVTEEATEGATGGAAEDVRPSPFGGPAGVYSGDPHTRYTIGEVVSELREDFPSLSVSKVRYLERRRLLQLERTSGGYRLFTDQDLRLLRLILGLQEREYLPLEVIKQRIDSGIIHNGDTGSSGGAGDPSGYPEIQSQESDDSDESRVYTKKEFCELLGADSGFIEELVSVGVIGRGSSGNRVSLESRDLEIARMAVEMSRYGIQPRHLRGIVAAVEREVAMFKQVLNPELRSGDTQRTAKAMESARYLASVDSRLKELIMSGSIESLEGNSQ